jgi:hypothetical protein
LSSGRGITFVLGSCKEGRYHEGVGMKGCITVVVLQFEALDKSAIQERGR